MGITRIDILVLLEVMLPPMWGRLVSQLHSVVVVAHRGDSELTPIGTTVTDATVYRSIDASNGQKANYLRLCQLQGRGLEFLNVGMTARRRSVASSMQSHGGVLFFFLEGSWTAPPSHRRTRDDLVIGLTDDRRRCHT